MRLKFQKEDDQGVLTGFAERVLAGIYVQASGYKKKKNVKKWHDLMVEKGLIKSFLNTKKYKFSIYRPQYHIMLSLQHPIAVGNEIEYSIPISKSKTIEFAPKGKVFAIQYLRIRKLHDLGVEIEISNDKDTWYMFNHEYSDLARRSGFLDLDTMLDYLIPGEPKEGESLVIKQKLVHWTTLKYPVGEINELNNNEV